MSRIGQNPINIPAGVNIDLKGTLVKVKGQKGSLEYQVHKDMNISEHDGTVLVNRNSDAREQRAIHGTTRQMIHNMVVGVSEGFSKELEIIGVGYQAQVQGTRLRLQLGYSHDIYFDMPEGITVTANRTEVKVEGIDKQLVGAVAAKIRSFRPPEPYKGKGIRYKGEYVRSKQGKTVGAK
ncbi:MAG: 50S ribosomal protein L6 [Candidatus Marinimicrobia bacterium]|mgnify:FL=1|jgi:large subunit ribosomal protein L6|nr:50S ribosomal protein L6 [Candidatus Neomarinimicrobiota bacterium]MCS5646907.1 50S ribosomal protein L6 [Candidatus Neomarinimicrobiota bacterium]|tara:strand:+ start:6867 stop:7406 length:540 start_codon:yes stop_codon:yes gene_type:complete